MGVELINFSKNVISDIRKNKAFLLIIISVWVILNLLYHHSCPVVLLCGFPCPGCGLTRAFFSFFTLHPVRAFMYNPTYPLWLSVIIAAIWLRYVKGQALKKLYFPLLFTAIMTLIVYIYRMIFMFPSLEPMVYVHENLFSYLNSSYDAFVTTLFR
ncbi:DUF2752 domain-containing protein [Butyrivibrio sp. VCB2006]|uniref:DUF2752 domain-containing protein n=1 Tax=Butyrivibrio sp. VCB2006 TaxID=1280679 RepID=UPI0004922DC1